MRGHSLVELTEHDNSADDIMLHSLYIDYTALYILLLPGFGVVSHILATFSRKPVFRYLGMVYAMLSNFYCFLLYGDVFSPTRLDCSTVVMSIL